MSDNQMREHLMQQRVENALFLLECGESKERVAKRLGLKPSTLDSMILKHGKGRVSGQ